MAYPFKEIEQKWRKWWEDNKTDSVDLNSDKPKYYNLCMFPYPSGDRLHMGHWFQYGSVDTHARFKRMMGFNVLQPAGYDSFGLPTENYSIKNNIHPAEATRLNIEKFTKQYKGIGGMYDWDHYLATSDPEYYKWTQWLFLTLYKHGLAYQEDALANWCPECATVVANAEVTADGTHERCKSVIERKPVKSWFFKITDYAERLLEDLDKTNYPESTKIMQRNWIGKSEGAKVKFEVADSQKSFEIFTTRPDTLYGVTYCVIAPESSFVDEIVTDEQKTAVEEYRTFCKTLSEIDRQSTVREKTGVFTGAYALNPVNGSKVPIWISDYVLASYGTGCVMAVPAHDQRDFEFAKKFGMDIKVVINPKGKELDATTMEEAYTEAGVMVNSAEFDGMKSKKGIHAVIQKLEKEGYGEGHINYKLRDWSISRQRYWGAPIPIIYCEKCGTVPVPEKDLPVKLPLDAEIEFKPKGKAPLELIDSYMNCTCPTCVGAARRDGETMDTFVCSSWYFLRFINPKLKDKPFDREEADKWMPVDHYVGGPEHINGHMLYSRFVTKALNDYGYLGVDEPFDHVTHQGMITKGGVKMSKSKGNAVSPDEFIEEYGTDVFRMYVMFMTNFKDGGEWADDGINGVDRFIGRIWRLVKEYKFENTGTMVKDEKLNYTLNHTIKEMTKNLDDFFFNTAISRMMELVNELYIYMKDEKRFNADFFNHVMETLCVLLAPFAPHVAEEMWVLSGHEPSVHLQEWPKHDEGALVKSTQIITVQINGKVRANLEVGAEAKDEEIKELVYGDEKVKKYTDGKNIFKTILINAKNGKMVNLVVK